MSKSFTISKQVLNVRTISLGMIGILILSVMIQSDAFASILSANVRNAVSNTDIFSINNTSTTRYIHVDFNGKTFVTYGADFNNSTSIFDSSKILIRNPTSTFAYTLTGSAITANRSLTIPLITGSDKLAVLGLAQNFTQDQGFVQATPNTWFVSTSAAADSGLWRTRVTATSFLIQAVNDAKTSSVDVLELLSRSGTTVPQVNLLAANIQSLRLVQGTTTTTEINTIPGRLGNLTTSTSDGFLYLPAGSGTPTGTPTSFAGHLAAYVDGQHNKLCIYYTSWKCVTLS